jgi:hypothetical protein
MTKLPEQAFAGRTHPLHLPLKAGFCEGFHFSHAEERLYAGHFFDNALGGGMRVPVEDQPGNRDIAVAQGFHTQQRMVDAAQVVAGNQDDWQPELLNQVDYTVVVIQRDMQPAGSFRHEKVIGLWQFEMLQSDLYAIVGSTGVGRHRQVEAKALRVDLPGSSSGPGRDLHGVGIMEVTGLHRFPIVGFQGTDQECRDNCFAHFGANPGYKNAFRLLHDLSFYKNSNSLRAAKIDFFLTFGSITNFFFQV